jgi:hypothetical protein
MKVWILTDWFAGTTDVFSSEEKVWDAIFAWFNEEDDEWTLDEVKERLKEDTDHFEIRVCEVK